MKVESVIASDHREIVDMFDELTPLAADDRRASEAMRLATKLAVALRTLGLAEEKVLYEVIRTASARLAACALEGPHELHALDTVLERLLALRPGPEFRAALAVARRLFDAHAEHEASELIPALAQALPDDECEQLGNDFVSAKSRLRPQVARHIGPLARPRLGIL
jgi:hypothetical protein